MNKCDKLIQKRTDTGFFQKLPPYTYPSYYIKESLYDFVSKGV